MMSTNVVSTFELVFAYLTSKKIEVNFLLLECLLKKISISITI